VLDERLAAERRASLRRAESEEYENWFTRCIYADEETREPPPLPLPPCSCCPPATPFPAIRHVSRNRDLGAKLDRAAARPIDLLGLARNLSRSLRGRKRNERNFEYIPRASADRSSGRQEKKDPTGDHRPGNVSPRRRISRSVGENDEAE